MDKGMDGWAEQGGGRRLPQGDRMKTRSESCHRIQGSQKSQMAWKDQVR